MKLIFDIETIGDDFEKYDKDTREALTWWIQREADSEEEYRVLLENVKDQLGFSPLTGEIVAIGVLDADRDKGVVYYQAPGQTVDNVVDEGITYKALTEKEMLQQFWEGAKKYNEFISFNGRTFDVPFLMVRSAIHGVRPSKNLMSNRYLSSQWTGAVHVDLLDQLTFYGAMRKRGNMHLWTRAFGIKSPKGEGVKGEDVAKLFNEGKYEEIAKYNGRDLFATKELYEYWDQYLRF